MHYTAWEYFFLLGGGFLAGIINTLAGNGSAITLPLLLSMGMDANTANATNRVGVLLQTFTAVASIKRTAQSKILIKESVWYYHNAGANDLPVFQFVQKNFLQDQMIELEW